MKTKQETATENTKEVTNNVIQLTSEIERKTAELQKVLADLERKKVLSKNRLYFMNVLDEISLFKEDISKEDILESERGFIELQQKRNYRNEKVCKISNPYILLKFADFIELEIKDKIKTMEIDQIPKSKLVQKISKLIAGEKPNIIYLPYRGDVHSDHKIVFDSVVSASKSFRNNSIERILCYETISETDFSINPDSNYFRPNVFVDISKYMHKKEEIISVYESEIGEHPFPRSVECIRALAVVRGGMSSFKFAEAFMLLKERLE